MHVVVGTKIGKLFVVELASGIVKEIEGAHASVLWSVCVFPTGKGLATASADKTVKFWSFSLEKTELSLALVKTLEVTSLSSPPLFCFLLLKISRLSRRLLVFASAPMPSTWPCHSWTIQSRFSTWALSSFSYLCIKHGKRGRGDGEDGERIEGRRVFEFFLFLFFWLIEKRYGHKLPVLSISISSDSALIATASADKNLKISIRSLLLPRLPPLLALPVPSHPPLLFIHSFVTCLL